MQIINKLAKLILIQKIINVIPYKKRKYFLILSVLLIVYVAYSQHKTNQFNKHHNLLLSVENTNNQEYKFLYVSDGDTFAALHQGKTIKIRLAYIDAPEKNQYLGDIATKELENMCKETNIAIEQTGLSYNRIVAVVNCNGIQINKYMLEKGLASLDNRYSKNQPDYYLIQAQAQQQKIGIWEKEFISPQTCRKEKICN